MRKQGEPSTRGVKHRMSAIGVQPSHYQRTWFPHGWSSVPAQSASPVFTVRSTDPNRLLIRMPGFRQDTFWASAMNQVIHQAVTRLNQFRSAESLLGYLAHHYHGYKAAEAYPHPQIQPKDNGYYNTQAWHQFGQFRSVNTNTPPQPIQGRYQPYAHRAQSLLGNRPNHVMTVNVGGTRLHLTQTLRTPHGLAWQWMPPQQLPLALAALNQVYHQIHQLRGQPRTPHVLHQTLENVARFHWLMVQAMPFQRGSAGIADMASRVLLDAAGIKTGPWRAGLAPDLEALVTPLESFTQNYAQLFETHPHY